MLLDRRKVKFWQKIIFGFMAFLMAAFLVVGYSGVLNGCSWVNSAPVGDRVPRSGGRGREEGYCGVAHRRRCMDQARRGVSRPSGLEAGGLQPRGR